MKLSFFSKMIGLAALSLSVTLLPLTPASAQDVAPDTGVGTDTTTEIETEDDGFDWGLLGLLGLIGLAGLAGKKHDDAPARYRDPAVSETEYRR